MCRIKYIENEANGPTQKLNVPPLAKTLQDYTKSPTNNCPPITPRTDVQQMNDREIATAYLLTLKRAGREHGKEGLLPTRTSISRYNKYNGIHIWRSS